MASKRFHIVMLSLLLMTAHVLAENKIAIAISKNNENGQTTTSARFAEATCEDECHIATLTCTGNSIILEVGDVDAGDAAKAMVKEAQQIALKANKKTYEYSIGEMQFAEMTGSWWLSAHEQGSAPGEIPKAIAASRQVELRVAAKRVVLPVDAQVKAWASACK